MAGQNENVTRLRNAYTHWAAHKAADCRCWTELAADDLKLRSAGEGRPALEFTAPRNGKEELLAYLSELTAAWEMVRHDMGDFIAEGDRVVVIGEVAWRNKATGRLATTPKIDVWRFRNGKAVEFWEYYDTAPIREAATHV